jgi:hypothetical protein
MLSVLSPFLLTLSSVFRSRTALQVEILALRHQISVLRRSAKKRPKLTVVDRVFGAWLSGVWTDWQSALDILKPETVIVWHRRDFRLFWTWKIRHGRAGRSMVSPEVGDLIRTMRLGGQWPDRDLAVTLNRMRSKAPDRKTWTTTRVVRDLRERLGIPVFDYAAPKEETISVDETAMRLKVCVGSVKRLIRDGVLPATQLMPSAPWQVPVAELDSDAVKIGVRAVVERRPRNF